VQTQDMIYINLYSPISH